MVWPITPLNYLIQSSSIQHHLHSFPTRRSSDLSSAAAFSGAALVALVALVAGALVALVAFVALAGAAFFAGRAGSGRVATLSDRKSTRLNSSHPSSSYVVFCLKKKNLH